MAKTDLTAQRLRELVHYDPETGEFTWRVKTSIRNKVGAIAGNTDSNGYRRLCIDSQKIWAHRAAWLYMTGDYPRHNIDHIDGNPSNNAFSNLRDVTQKMNIQNVKKANKKSTTGFLGVERCGKKFLARIRTGRTRFALGRFATPEEAHIAYIEAKRRLHEGCTI